MDTIIFGLGAIGSRVAIEIARIFGHSHFAWTQLPQIAVVDDDIVEIKNTFNQVYMERHVGRKKTTVITHMMSEVSRMIYSYAWSERVTSENVSRMVSGFDLAADCFDNAASRMAVANACNALNVPCLHVGLNVGYGGIRWNSPSYTVSDEDGSPDVCTAHIDLGLSQFVAAAAVSNIVHFLTNNGEQINLTIGIENFSVIAS